MTSRPSRFPGGSWGKAALAVVAAAGAILLAGSGARGAVLHGVGWPLLLVLLVLQPGPFAGPAGPRRLCTFASLAGSFPLILALLFGPENGLLAALIGGVVFGLGMTLFNEWWFRSRRNRASAR